MKNALLISILLTFIFSCEKENNFCDSKECQEYFKIWKDLFISRNQLTEDYFNDHVFPFKTEIDKWNDAQSFRVEYKIKIDWAEAVLSDQFAIWIDPSTAGLYPAIQVPRSVFLTKGQINEMLDIFAFSSSVHKVAKIDHLKYTTYADAISELETASGIKNLGQGEVTYLNPSFNEDFGHPLLKVGATISWQENRCMRGTLNLVTGDKEIRESVCVIYFCFVKGTNITLSDGTQVPIEKVRTSDKVLSCNIEKLSAEEDIIEKIDSVYHNNIIRISFDDSAIIESTADHPYYVRDKGWCSFNPSETFEKYKIETKQLRTGDVCLKIENNRLVGTEISTITEIPGNVITYNISRLKKNKSYFANGILVSTEGI